MFSSPLQPKKCLILGDFPMKNLVKILWIPMSSLGGAHLISGIDIFISKFSNKKETLLA